MADYYSWEIDFRIGKNKSCSNNRDMDLDDFPTYQAALDSLNEYLKVVIDDSDGVTRCGITRIIV